MRVLSYLIAGVACTGCSAGSADHLLGTGFLLPLGYRARRRRRVYTIIRRFGQVPDAPPAQRHAPAPAATE